MVRGNFFYQRLAEKIISLRQKRKLSQEQLALLSDLDRTYIARIEEGKANPSIKVLNKLARVLKTRISSLLKGV
ncbi:hypothetical protein A2954_07145 [Candidatus Roizmanbacteria bacterium RIFCSPLOWO2_01_FULL_37_12]|uniref:HTH cro/C1-type domain-containing protein n=1 Tax=Candidatus Roizmanbacteria bacterium RIFCSPLOWO2_01_FULL_37_12 TaxID=1802056 RepID=A0A1F7IE38_9BACT|nr:MAG: hypothetical protein A3D76_01060 [Candidatus Roizmanbacteria bacterium RIFCSPHIGHO2_02_FULL_37_9b]OGK41628.1 MAG: hypothetical protein A2954_07145 [Candidatus Roizmanbacteria bacterium RIFCSPLOWO2_01_FULL_37_12]